MAEQEQSPVAWTYELARAKLREGGYTDWAPTNVAFLKPCVPEGSIRNLTPLYAIPTPDAVNADKAVAQFAVAGPWASDDRDENDNAVWRAEVQTIGGHSVVAEVWGGSADEAKQRANAICAALATPAPDKALMPEAAVGEKYTPGEFAFLQDLMDRYSEGGGFIDLGLDHAAFVGIVRKHYPTPTPVEGPEKGAAGELRAAAEKLRDHFKAYPSGYATRHDLGELFAALAATNAGQVEALEAWIAYDEGRWSDNTTGMIEAYGRAIAVTRAALAAFKKSEVGHG